MTTVLFVDDEPVLLDIAGQFFEQDPSFRVLTACSVYEGLKILASQQIDAIVSDYEMPEKNGLDFLREVRAAGFQIPFIMFTGRGREEVVINAIASGADFYLRKGDDPKTLFADLKEKIERAIQFRGTGMDTRRAEDIHRTLFEAVPDGIVIIENGRFIDINTRACKLFHLPAESILGKTVTDLSPQYQPDGIPSIQKAETLFSRVLSGQPVEIEWDHLLPDGSRLTLGISLTRIITRIEPVRILGILRDITGRKQAEAELARRCTRQEEALREAGEQNDQLAVRYQQAIENGRFLTSILSGLPGMAYRYRKESNTIEFISDGCRDLTGYDSTDFIDNQVISFKDLILPDDREAAGALHDRQSRSDLPDVTEYRIRCRDGSIRWVRDQRGVTLTENDGQIHEGFITDITAEKESEIALRQAEQIRAEIIESLPDPTLALDTEGKVIAWNQEMARLTGIPAGEILGMDLSDRKLPFTGENHPVLAALAASSASFPDTRSEIRRTGDVLETEIDQAGGDTGPCTFWTRARPLAGPDGTIHGAVESVRDLSSIKKTIAILTEEEKKTRLLVENQADVVFALSPDGTVEYTGPSIYAFGGYEPGEITGTKAVQYITDPAGSAEVSDQFRELLAARRPGTVSFLFLAADGQEIPAEATLSPIIVNGDVIRIQGILRDVSEQHRREGELRSAYEALQIAYDEAKSVQRSLAEENVTLDEKMRFLSRLLETIPGIIFRMNPLTGKILHMSGDIAGLTGYDHETFERGEKGFADLVHPDEMRHLSDLREEAGGKGTVFEHGYQVMHADRTSRWVYERSCMINPEETGDPLVEGILFDITRYRQAEDGLKQSLATIRAIFDNTTDAIIVHDPEGRILEVNQEFFRMVRISPDRMTSLTMQDLFTSDTPDPVPSAWEEVLGGRELTRVWLVNRPSDGTRFMAEASLRRLDLRMGPAILVNIRDITARIETEERILAETKRHQAEWEAIYTIARDPSLPGGIIDRFCEGTIRTISTVLGSEIRIWLLDTAGETIRRITDPDNEDERNDIRLSDHPLLFERLAEQIDLVAHADTSPEEEEILIFGAEDAGSLIGGVIRAGGTFVGLVTASSDPERNWEPDERLFLVQSADLIAGAVQAATLREQREEIMRNHEELETSYAHLNEKETELRAMCDDLLESREQLRRSENQYRSIFEYTGEASVILDQDLLIIRMNNAFERLSGCRPEMAGGSVPFLSVISSGDKARIQGHLERLAGGDIRAVSDEMQLVTTDGAIRFVAVLFGIIPETTEILVSLLDISDRVKIMQDLSEIRGELEATLDAIPDLLLELGEDGTVHDLRCHDPSGLLGLPDGMIGKRIQDLLSPAAAAVFDSSITAAREKGSFFGAVYECHTPDGSRWFDLSVARKGARSTPSSYIAISRDITSRKMAEEALVLTNRKLNILSGMTRHDILNKIAACRRYLDLIDTEEDPGEVRSHLWRLSVLIQDIRQKMEFTGAYQDIGLSKAGWSPVTKVIRDGLEASPSDIPVSVDIPDQYEVFSDPMISTVFMHLIGNTARHGKEPTFIRFSSNEDGNILVIRYEDDGGGIPDDQKEAVFEWDFGKTDGFGLFLAREILAITNLAISENGTPGEGVRFEITIPAGRYRTTGDTGA